MMKLTIDRRRWYRGEGEEWSRLLRNDGRMCCLGFLGRACGYSDEQLLDVATPIACVKGGGRNLRQPNLWPKGSVSSLGGYIMDLIRVNDSMECSEEDRERRITELMLHLDVEVEFEG